MGALVVTLIDKQIGVQHHEQDILVHKAVPEFLTGGITQMGVAWMSGKMIEGLAKKIAEAVSTDRAVPVDIMIPKSRKKGYPLGQLLDGRIKITGVAPSIVLKNPVLTTKAASSRSMCSIRV